MSEPVKARCKCGAVQFDSSSPPLIQFVCHCKDCQIATGLPFAGIVFFKRKHVEISGDLGQHLFIANTNMPLTLAIHLLQKKCNSIRHFC